MTKTTTLFNQREKGKSTLLHYAVGSKVEKDTPTNKEPSNDNNDTESNTSKKNK